MSRSMSTPPLISDLLGSIIASIDAADAEVPNLKPDQAEEAKLMLIEVQEKLAMLAASLNQNTQEKTLRI